MKRTAAISICTVIVLLLYRRYMKGNDVLVDPTVMATGKVVIVTGSNSGIGKETVRELAKRGATVYMACRSMKRCEGARQEIVTETQNPDIHCRQLDLSDFVSIRAFVQEFKTEQPRLDILINNGGVNHISPKAHTKQGIELQLGVNHVGPFLLTTLLLDYLKKSAPSRIVVVSSLAHAYWFINFDDLNTDNCWYQADAAYAQSKLASVLFTRQLAKNMNGTGVTVNALHPGFVATDIIRHFPFHDLFRRFFIDPAMQFFFKSPRQGSLTSVYLALQPGLENVTGKYFVDCTETPVASHAQRWEDAERLWRMTEDMITEKS